MYNQTEAILSQYELEIQEVTKGRGAFICDTNKGKLLLVPFRGSKEKGALLAQFLATVEEKEFPVEQIEMNKSQEAVTEDEYTGERYILKTYIEGSEISTSKTAEMKGAVALLAMYHNVAQGVEMKVPVQHRLEGTTEVCRRHYRELVKVRNYIRNRKKKNEFEQIYMKNFEHNRKSAEDSLVLLEEQGEANCLYCHGDYNQHNVLLVNGAYRIVHFENLHYNWAMIDLANFVRKMLEKNAWEEKLGIELLSEYHHYRPIRREEFQQLCGLLLFPEKFWKVTNHYMNSRKAWISERDIEKLKTVIEQEERRLKFMENLFSFVKE